MARSCKHGKLKSPRKSKGGRMRVCRKRSRKSKRKSKRKCKRGMRKGTRSCKHKPGRKKGSKSRKRKSKKGKTRAMKNWMKVRDMVLSKLKGVRRARAASNWKKLGQKAVKGSCPGKSKSKSPTVVCEKTSAGEVCKIVKAYAFGNCRG